MVNYPMLEAVFSGKIDLEEVNEIGLKVTELESPWMEEILALSRVEADPEN